MLLMVNSTLVTYFQPGGVPGVLHSSLTARRFGRSVATALKACGGSLQPKRHGASCGRHALVHVNAAWGLTQCLRLFYLRCFAELLPDMSQECPITCDMCASLGNACRNGSWDGLSPSQLRVAPADGSRYTVGRLLARGTNPAFEAVDRCSGQRVALSRI